MKPALIIIPILIILVSGAIFLNSKPTPTLTSIPTPIPSNTPIPIPTNTPTPIPSLEPSNTPTLTKPDIKTQIIKATYGSPFGFTPTEFTVKSGVPVRLEVYATENGRGCMGSLMVPDFSNKIEGFYQDQISVIEFTPTTQGEYYITCAMGIPHAFIVVE